jgi:cold-shock-like DNA binding protein
MSVDSPAAIIPFERFLECRERRRRIAAETGGMCAVAGEGLQDLREGDRVEFDVGDGPQGPRAENVRRTSTLPAGGLQHGVGNAYAGVVGGSKISVNEEETR